MSLAPNYPVLVHSRIVRHAILDPKKNLRVPITNNSLKMGIVGTFPKNRVFGDFFPGFYSWEILLTDRREVPKEP